MDKRNEIREELKELSPFLSKLKEKGDGFSVPANYFESLSEEIFDKTGLNSSKAVKHRKGIFEQFIESLQLILQPRYAMALASIAILLVAGIYFLRPASGNNTQEVAIMAELTNEEIGDYINSNIDDFATDLMVEAETEGIDITPELEADPSEVEEYLDNIIDEIDIDELEELL